MTKSGIEVGFLLDRQWHCMRGEVERSKRPTLLTLAQVFARAGTDYAIIGGVALQAHQREPRTTLAVAVVARSAIPREQLRACGFQATGSFEHSENWAGPDGTPVQFTDDPALRPAIARADVIDLDGCALRALGRTDLLHEKLRAGSDPGRRRSKRLQDLADVQGLLETQPGLAGELSAEERRLLERLP